MFSFINNVTDILVVLAECADVGTIAVVTLPITAQITSVSCLG